MRIAQKNNAQVMSLKAAYVMVIPYYHALMHLSMIQSFAVQLASYVATIKLEPWLPGEVYLYQAA